MLQSGAQVIVRWQCGPDFQCESFDGLAVKNPALIVIAHCGTRAAQRATDDLRRGLANELAAMGAIQQSIAPCGPWGQHGFAACHAEEDPDCQKLLVLIGDGVQRICDKPDFQHWQGARGDRTVLPILPATSRLQFTTLFPNWVGTYNANWWTHSPIEALPAVLGGAGITAEQPKIFISYRQAESSILAMQIFDGLSHAGFDVFLDHFRIPPGINFQARLTEQLGDKSMVLFLETTTFLQSQWVTYEVNVAKTCGLGIHALNLCGAPIIPGVDEELRTRLVHTDLTSGHLSSNAELTKPKLDEIVALVRRQHDRAIVRRRQILVAALEGAVLRAGGQLPKPIGSGTLQVDAKNGERYMVSLTSRPPDMSDFHRVHGQIAHLVKGVVVGLSRLMEPTRHQRLNWLAGLSMIELRDEGDILSLGQQMVQGTL